MLSIPTEARRLESGMAMLLLDILLFGSILYLVDPVSSIRYFKDLEFDQSNFLSLTRSYLYWFLVRFSFVYSFMHAFLVHVHTHVWAFLRFHHIEWLALYD